MTVWVDGDSCPPAGPGISSAGLLSGRIFSLIFVANREIPFKKSDKISLILTSQEEGSADRYIIEKSFTGDLVVTRDIPLAAELVAKGGRTVLNDRGTVYTKENVRERLAQRDFNQMMREAGLDDERSSNFGHKEIRAFSNTFDRTLRQMLLEEQFRKGIKREKTIGRKGIEKQLDLYYSNMVMIII